MEPELKRVQQVPCWRLLCSLMVIGIYAFCLAILGGIILWASLIAGASYEQGIIIVLAFYGLEIYSFIKDKPSPAVLLTNFIVVVLRMLIVRPATVVFSGTTQEIRTDISWIMWRFQDRLGIADLY